MRHFPQSRRTRNKRAATEANPGRATLIFVLAAVGFTQGCVGGGTGSAAPPLTPPPPPISVNVTPSSASVVLGNTQTFTATVTNGGNTSVTWSVNGVPQGSSETGTITATGIYTAPADLPLPSVVQVSATSNADVTRSASATVTIGSDIVVSVSPNPGSVELGAIQSFHGKIASSGNPDTAVRWSLTGAACPTSCGAVDANGNYTAPQILPAPAIATVIAQSVADPAKQASAEVSITSNFLLQLSAPASVPVSGIATIAATITPVPGSNPSTALSWSVSGPGCTGVGCGVLSVVTTQSSGGNPPASSATYTAPAVVPSPNTVTVTVMPLADPSKKAQAILAVQSGVGMSVSPGSATVAASHRVTLTAAVSGSTNTGVTWIVSGVGGGNSTVGQICASGVSPCQPVTGTNSLQVDYLAPGAIPSVNPVTIQAASVADTNKNATAVITVINHVVVSILPGTTTLPPLGVQSFSASVLGTTNQSVTWQLLGVACGAAGACGSIDASGIYTAPAATPSPNTLQVVAVSADDTSQSGSAEVTITEGAQVFALHPASVYAGAANGFTLRADGSGFIATSPGPGSALVIAGTARTSTCNSASECAAPVTPADVALPGTVSVQVRNPDGSSSNTVSLLVVAPNSSFAVITPSSAAPSATGKDILVVEPTTAGISTSESDVDLNVAALGAFNTTSNSCTLAGNPVRLVRPAGGTVTADICAFSQSGLDASMNYLVSGPGDIAVVSKQPAGLGIIHLTLQIPNTAAPGPRSLLIQNTNLDETAASGALEVQ
jgi:hypothetical protein